MKAKNEISVTEFKKLKKHNSHHEWDMQVEFFKHVNSKTNDDLVNPYNYIFAIPNGGNRDVKTAMYMKMAGTMPGIPDVMCLLSTRNGMKGLAIEFKSEKGYLSEDQKRWQNKLDCIGFVYCVCKSTDEAIEKIETLY